MVRHDDPRHIDAVMFLIEEAELLDADDLEAWLGLLAPELTYVMPVRESRLREDLVKAPTTSFHFKEDRASLELRVKRLVHSFAAWSANPGPRTRRFVSNVRVREAEGGELLASSYLLLLRSHHDDERYELLTAERSDRLGRSPTGALELRSREIAIDQTRLSVASLPIPF
jgi:3-phenylpropionate/cinnamic acid dioxygenase small subunit